MDSTAAKAKPTKARQMPLSKSKWATTNEDKTFEVSPSTSEKTTTNQDKGLEMPLNTSKWDTASKSKAAAAPLDTKKWAVNEDKTVNVSLSKSKWAPEEVQAAEVLLSKSKLTASEHETAAIESGNATLETTSDTLMEQKEAPEEKPKITIRLPPSPPTQSSEMTLETNGSTGAPTAPIIETHLQDSQSATSPIPVSLVVRLPSTPLIKSLEIALETNETAITYPIHTNETQAQVSNPGTGSSSLPELADEGDVTLAFYNRLITPVRVKDALDLIKQAKGCIEMNTECSDLFTDWVLTDVLDHEHQAIDEIREKLGCGTRMVLNRLQTRCKTLLAHMWTMTDFWNIVDKINSGDA